jgi:hypothetical protein
LVDVEEHAGVGVEVVTREGNTTGGGSAGARDGEFHAADVGLHSVEDVGAMKGNELSAEQVVARGDVGGKLDVHAAAVVEQSVNSPLSISCSVSILVDLEPHISRTRIGPCEVDDDGTKMGGVYDVVVGSIRVVVPLESNGGTSCYGALPVGCDGRLGQKSTCHVNTRNQRNRAIKRGKGV